MKSDTIKSILFLMVILIGGLALAPYLASVEGYENKRQVSLLPGIYPDTVDKPILNSFPLTGKTSVLNNTDKSNADTTIFEVGSYAQITNNMKYVQNPDNQLVLRSNNPNRLYLICVRFDFEDKI